MRFKCRYPLWVVGRISGSAACQIAAPRRTEVPAAIAFGVHLKVPNVATHKQFSTLCWNCDSGIKCLKLTDKNPLSNGANPSTMIICTKKIEGNHQRLPNIKARTSTGEERPAPCLARPDGPADAARGHTGGCKRRPVAVAWILSPSVTPPPLLLTPLPSPSCLRPGMRGTLSLRP